MGKPEKSRPGKISAQLPASQHAQQFPALPKTRFLHLQHQENLKRKKSEEEQENVIRAEEGPEPEQQLSALLNELPERSRQVMIMSHIENRKSADIARKLGISVRTVETILYQAMKKLRGKIKK